jgi:hypothetical protein
MLNNHNNNYDNSSSRPQILQSYVARNDFAGNKVILAEASSSMVDKSYQCYELFAAVTETARQLQSKAPTPGWEYASLPRQLRGLCPLSLKGMKFHIYDTGDRDEHNHGHNHNPDGDTFCIWEVGCIYDANTVGRKQVESFVKHVVMASKKIRENDRVWKDGGNYAARHQFSVTLQDMIPEVEYYAQLDELQTDVDILKETMGENIRKILEREERLEDLAMKAEQLKEAAGVFRNNAKKLKRAMRKKHLWQKAKYGVVGGTAITALALAITLPIVLI